MPRVIPGAKHSSDGMMIPKLATPATYDWRGLRKQLVVMFSDGDLRTLCFDLGLDYDMLAGNNKEERFRELLKILRDAQRMEDLIAICKQERSSVQWNAFERYGQSDDRLPESEVAVRAKLVEVKERFFKETTLTFWQWRYMVMKVAYYGNQAESRNRYTVACKEYDKQVWDVLFRIRTAISTSQLFVSADTYHRLLVLYDYIVRTDNELSGLIKSRDPLSTRRPKYLKFNQRIYTEVTAELESAIASIARDISIQDT